jgi:hypothetical protein
MSVRTHTARGSDVRMGPGNWILLGILLLVLGITAGPWVLAGWIVLMLARGLRRVAGSRMRQSGVLFKAVVGAESRPPPPRSRRESAGEGRGEVHAGTRWVGPVLAEHAGAAERPVPPA